MDHFDSLKNYSLIGGNKAKSKEGATSPENLVGKVSVDIKEEPQDKKESWQKVYLEKFDMIGGGNLDWDDNLKPWQVNQKLRGTMDLWYDAELDSD